MDFEERGYLTDQYKFEFSSRIREVQPEGSGRFGVYLDRTFFYPVSGGQPADGGTLNGKRVIEVTEDDRGVRHLVETEFRQGDEVEGCIDWHRRFDHMQQHSGQHLLSHVFLEMLGAVTVGFHLGESICTIDLDTDLPSPDRLEEVESAVNGLIWKNIPIKDSIVGRDDYEKIRGTDGGAGNRVVHSRLPDEAARVRIVEIVGIDRSTCCGTHCGSTGEIGIVKVLGVERVKGRARVEFVCGERALRDYAVKQQLLGSLALRFSTDWRELDKIIGKLTEEHRAFRKANDELGRELAGFRAAKLAASSGAVGGFGLVRKTFQETDMVSLREMAASMSREGGRVVLLGVSTPRPGLVFACSPEVPLDMGDLIKECSRIMGARGGGSKDLAQGGGGDGGLVEKALDEAERRIREVLE